MSIVGDHFVWFLDPIGAMCIALLILFSWVSNAFEQVWLLVGKSAPKEFISKLVYMTITHDTQILKVETVSGYNLTGPPVQYYSYVSETCTDKATVPSLPRWAKILCRGGHRHGPEYPTKDFPRR